MTPIELCHLLAYSRDYKLGLTCLHALTYIYAMDEIQINHVARHIGITSAAMTGVADKLHAMGYITRISGKKDRRNIWLETTPRGAEIILSALRGPIDLSFAEAV